MISELKSLVVSFAIISVDCIHSFCTLPRSPGLNTFTFDRDPSLAQQPTSPSSAGASSNSKDPIKQIPVPLTPNLTPSRKLYCVSPCAKWIFCGGHWDNSLQVFSLTKLKTVTKVIRHIDVITCLCMDASGNYVMTGSRDTTSIVWEVTPLSVGAGASSGSSSHNSPHPRPIQVLSGHDKSVSCVALSTELDMAVSGSDDGSINVYTVKEGQYIR